MRLFFSVILLLSGTSFADTRFSESVESRLDQVVSVFENSETEVQYGYIEALGDGRGYTAGKVGFTTATGDLVMVVESYLKIKSQPEFERLLPLLKKRAEEHSSSTEGLKELLEIWPRCANDRDFRKAQDEIADGLYRRPARDYLKQTGLKSALAYLIFYDTLVQHGEGDDPDSFNSILTRTKNGSSFKNEGEFLEKFLSERTKTLLNPADPDTADEWRESVDRVYALKRLLRQENFNLSGSFKLFVWGRIFRIK